MREIFPKTKVFAKQKIDLSKTAVNKIFVIHEEKEPNYYNSNCKSSDTTNTAMFPVTALMLDIVTELGYSDYDFYRGWSNIDESKYKEDETILKNFGCLKKISIIVFILLDKKHAQEPCFAIGLVGNITHRIKAKIELTELMAKKEEKLIRQNQIDKFQNRAELYSEKYFEMKIQKSNPSTPPQEQRKIKVCWNCHATEALDGGKLSKCSGCNKARYCGSECQAEDWERHKEYCEKKLN